VKKFLALSMFSLVILSSFVFAVREADAHGGPPPANQPKRGLIYDGLESPSDGSCKGGYKVKTNVSVKGRAQCSHGPDAAFGSMNVSQSVAPLSSAAAAITCDGDGVSGKRVQVMYAHASDVPDNYATYLASFQQWAADADADFNSSAAETGGTRHIRFVHDANCMPVVLDVTLSPTGDDVFGYTLNELIGQGYNRSDRDYMLFVDSRIYCGISTMEVDDQAGTSNLSNLGAHYGRIDAGCWSGVIAAHELMHNLGGVQYTAPNSDGNTHCNDGYDNMCNHSGHVVAVVCPAPVGYDRFDCNHNDYYSTNPPAGSYLATHWNTANNQFLINPGAPAPVAQMNSMLTGVVSKSGTFTAATTFSAGSTVTARAHVVDQTGSNLPGASVTLSFKRPDGSIQCTVTAKTDASGTAQASCAVKRNAPKGNWSLHAGSVALSSSTTGDDMFTVQ
jgi:hypothetical protein